MERLASRAVHYFHGMGRISPHIAIIDMAHETRERQKNLWQPKQENSMQMIAVVCSYIPGKALSEFSFAYGLF